MRFFFDAELSDHSLHGGLDAASVNGSINQMCIFEPALAVRKKKLGMPMDRPETSQGKQRLHRQWDQPVLVPLGVADMGPHAGIVDIAGLQSDSFAKAQTKRVGCEKENPIAQFSRGSDQVVELFDGKNIRDFCGRWRFDQGNVVPGFTKHPVVEEFQAIEVDLDSAPGTFIEQIVEIIEELVGGQVVDPAVEIVTDPPDCP